MSTQEDVGDLQLQQKSYFCHSCQLEFRKNPDEVSFFRYSLCDNLINQHKLRSMLTETQ